MLFRWRQASTEFLPRSPSTAGQSQSYISQTREGDWIPALFGMTKAVWTERSQVKNTRCVAIASPESLG